MRKQQSRSGSIVPTVRPCCRGRFPVLLCIIAFLATAAVVYRWGYERWTPVRHGPRYTATAYVAGPYNAANEESQSSDSRPADGGTIAFTRAGDDPRRIAAAVDAMADRHVGERRAEWLASQATPSRQARARAEESRRALAAATAQLEAIERQLRESKAAAGKASATTDKPQPPAVIDNPRWLDLQRRLAELRRQRERLLVDRTPIHPAVQAVDDKITETQQQLAATPQTIPNPKARRVAAENPKDDATRRRTAEAASKEGQKRRAELAAAVEQRRLECAEAERAEQLAEQQLQAAPNYEVQRAKIVENPAPADLGWRRMVWTSLATAFLAALGVGTTLWGRSIELPVASVAEVQTVLGEPVVGVIPIDDPLSILAVIDCLKRRRRTMVLAGLLLLAIAPAVAAWGVFGI